MRHIHSPVLTVIFVVLGVGTALALDENQKAAVRALADDAERDFQAGHYDQAYQKFRRAYDAAKVPKLAVWTARSLIERGRLVGASEMLREARRLAPNELWIGDVQRKAQEDAKIRLDELLPRIPTLRIRIEGAAKDDVEVTMDGVKIVPALLELEIPCDPGLRQVVGKSESETVSRAIDLAQGQGEDVVLRFGTTVKVDWTAGPTVPVATPHRALDVVSPPPPQTVVRSSRSSARRTWGFVALGIGGTGLLTGIGTGVAVLSSDLRAKCPNDTCDPSKTSRTSVNHYNTLRTVTTVGFIAGGVGTAIGLTLLLWPTADEKALRTSIWFGPSSAGLAGTF